MADDVVSSFASPTGEARSRIRYTVASTLSLNLIKVVVVLWGAIIREKSGDCNNETPFVSHRHPVSNQKVRFPMQASTILGLSQFEIQAIISPIYNWAGPHSTRITGFTSSVNAHQSGFNLD